MDKAYYCQDCDFKFRLVIEKESDIETLKKHDPYCPMCSRDSCVEADSL